MTRRVFYSFHYKPDNWRVAKVRNIGAIEDNKPASDNDWEEVTGKGDKAIQKWINDQLKGRSCVVVLIGEKTAGRKWIKYEIEEGWEAKKGVLGIYIHNLKDRDEKQSNKGSNPFKAFKIGDKSLSSIVKAYDPPHTTSAGVRNYIADHLEDWIEEAIRIRKEN